MSRLSQHALPRLSPTLELDGLLLELERAQAPDSVSCSQVSVGRRVASATSPTSCSRMSSSAIIPCVWPFSSMSRARCEWVPRSIARAVCRVAVVGMSRSGRIQRLVAMSDVGG
jgi:hypothetical protein